MKRKKSFEISEELLNKIISVAYGDAGLWDRFYVTRLAEKYPEVKNVLSEYKSTSAEIHKLSEEECPDEIIVNIEKQTANVNKRINSFTADFLTIVFTRPIFSAAAVVIIIGFLVFGILENRVPQYKYSKAEIEIADKQAKHALAIVGKIFAQTNITLKEEVLNSRVAKPIRESMGIVNEFLTSENELNKEK